MLKLTLNAISIFSIFTFSLFNCSPSKDLTSFERNDPDPEYRLFNLLDDYPALKEPFSNLDEREFNDKLNGVINRNKDESQVFLSHFEEIVYHVNHPLTDTIAVLRNVLWRIINQDELDVESLDNDPNKSDDHFSSTADFLDSLSEAELGITGNALSLGRKIMQFINDRNTPEEIEESMTETIEDMVNGDEEDKDAAISLQEMIGKIIAQSNENMWIYDDDSDPSTPDKLRLNREEIDIQNDKDTGLGNTARGVESFLSGAAEIARDEDVKQYLFDILREYGDISTSEVNGKKAGDIFKDLICNIEDHMTIGGAAYGDGTAETDYHKDGDVYVDNELGNTIKEIMPIITDLLIRGDRELSVISGNDYPLELLAKAFNTMDISDESVQKLEDSLYKMIRFDEKLRDRLLDPESSDFTAMDKLLWLLGLISDVGWRTTGTSDDKFDDFDNHGRYPEIPTHGILTLNDATIALTTAPEQKVLEALAKIMFKSILDVLPGAVEYWFVQIIRTVDDLALWLVDVLTGLEMNLYSLGVDNPPGNLIHRYNKPFTAADIQNGEYPFYLAPNCPGLVAMSGEQLIGDFGTPWGGRHFTGVKLPWEFTGSGGGIYVPYCRDGLGTQSAVEWILGFMARIVWEGQAPYYCRNRLPDQAATQVIDGKTYQVYYAPSGQPAVWVDKSNPDPAKWIYREPKNGFAEEDGYICKYRTQHTLDYYLVQLEDQYGKMRYYPFNHDLYNGEGAYAPPGTDPWNKDGGLGKYVADNCSEDDENCVGSLDQIKANTHIFNENIPGSMTLEDGTVATCTNADRECETYEETIYKNMKWMLYEKKYFLLLPFPLAIDVFGGIVSASAMAYVVLEGNGITALLSAGKTQSSDPENFSGDGNAKWKIKNDYGYSDRPGDSKFTCLMEGGQAAVSILGLHLFLPKLLTYTLAYDAIFGTGGLMYSSLAENIGAMDLLVFMVPGLKVKDVPSFACGKEHSFWKTHGNKDGKNPYWEDRNSLLSVLSPLVGELHMHAKLNNDINDQTVYPKSVLAFRSIRSLLPLLAKPLLHYKQDENGPPPVKCWSTELNNIPGLTEEGMPHSGIDTSKWGSPWLIPGPYLDPDYPRPPAHEEDWKTALPINAKNFYQPKYKRTLISMLAESNPEDFPAGRCNGYLSLPYGFADSLVLLIKKIGASKFDDPPGADPDDYTTWGARKKIFYGLEQIATGIKLTKGAVITRGIITDEMETLTKREWMFAENGTRPEDILLDDIIEDMVGHDAAPDSPGKGLANYPDEKPNPEDWNEFLEDSEENADLQSNKTASLGKYNLIEDIIGLLDNVLGKVEVTDRDARGLRHTLGTLFSTYNHSTNKWEYPDDLDVLTTAKLPDMMKVYEGHYSEFVTFILAMLEKEGFLDYIMNTFESPSYTSQEILLELYDFLGDDIIARYDSSFWEDMALMMTRFAEMMDSETPGWTDELFGSNEGVKANPYEGLGDLLTR